MINELFFTETQDDEQDNLQGNEFSTNSGLLTQDGAVLMGGTNGFNLFYPKNIKTNTYPPPVAFTDFQILNRSIPVTKNGILTRPVWAIDTIELSYKDNVISFEFAALNYIFPEKNVYAVFMENFDKDWHYIGRKRFETYNGLSTGTYILRVKAANNDGVWSKKEARIVLIIRPPWWKTSWFRTSFVFLTIILLVSIYYGISYLVKSRKKLLKELATHQDFAPQKIEKKEVTPQYKKIFKNKEEIEQLKKTLHEVVVNQEWYKEETISLSKIAKKMGITGKKLSELFNKELNTNFYEYINSCKINAFKERVEKGDAEHLKLISIAYESGFHSKATFNRIFKQHTGLTPSQFKKKIEDTLSS